MASNSNPLDLLRIGNQGLTLTPGTQLPGLTQLNDTATFPTNLGLTDNMKASGFIHDQLGQKTIDASQLKNYQKAELQNRIAEMEATGKSPFEIRAMAQVFVRENDPTLLGSARRIGDTTADAARNIWGNMQSAWNVAGENIEKTKAGGMTDDLGVTKTGLRASLRSVGELAKVGNRIVEEGIYQGGQVILPEAGEQFVKEGVEAVGQKVASIPQVSSAMQAYLNWANQNPELAKDLAAGGEIALFATNFIGGGAAGKAGSKAGSKIFGEASEATGSAVTKTTQGIGKTLRSGTKFLLGDDAGSAVLKSFDDPVRVGAFKSGQKSFQNIADDATKAITKFQTNSKTKFQAVKNALPGAAVDKAAVLSQVDEIKKSFRSLLPQEKSTVDDLIKTIDDWQDWTDKGVLELRQMIDRSGFYREAGENFTNSNRIIKQVRQKLNEAATAQNPAMKKALKEATDEIDLLEKMGYSLEGVNAEVNVEATANRLRALATKIDDPLEKQATKQLLDELKKRTGVDIAAELEAIKAAKTLTKPSPSIFSTGKKVEDLLTKGTASGARAIKEKFPTPKPQKKLGELAQVPRLSVESQKELVSLIDKIRSKKLKDKDKDDIEKYLSLFEKKYGIPEPKSYAEAADIFDNVLQNIKVTKGYPSVLK